MNLSRLIVTLISGPLLFSMARADNETKFSSPDGKFAMVLTQPEEGAVKIQLIEVSSGKVVLDLADSGQPHAGHCKLVWSPDSQRFAFYQARHRGGDTTVYFRNESGFAESPLPELGDCATASEKKELEGKGVHKFIEGDTAPKQWLKSGGLVLMNAQGWETKDGNLRGCTQTVTIAFDAKHKASIQRVADKKQKDY
ncbi:MAG TPA: hypothetical protein VH227_05270 [Candidatus Udaeobacter sp.]|jgi:hypothetical protein|nr:hypothetical protein [Candidatus Udaeobacter sp.]